MKKLLIALCILCSCGSGTYMGDEPRVIYRIGATSQENQLIYYSWNKSIALKFTDTPNAFKIGDTIKFVKK